MIEFLYLDPNAWDASSITLNLYFFANELIFSKSHGFPPRWTGIRIFGSLFFFLACCNFCSKAFTSILNVSLFISTRSILAPQYIPQLAEAIKVIGTVQR